MPDSSDVLIVLPPFGPACYPSVGASILAAGCRQRRISTEVYYANLLFAARIGYDRYQHVTTSAVQYLVGEAIFRDAAFPSRRAGFPNDAIDASFAGGDPIPTAMEPDLGVSRADAELCWNEVPGFLDEALDAIVARRPRIVGFSSVFQQNLAAIAMMRGLAERAPETLIVFGGGNAAEPMGSALAEVVDACDHVFSGEADFVFPDFCEAILAGADPPTERTIHCDPVYELDATPQPDYSDYYRQVEGFAAAGRLPASLPLWLHFETSRGCWYGAKNHCKFCGLNGLEIGYRRKSADRIIADIRDILETWSPPQLSATDNIMPIEFKQDVLPRLAEEPLDVELFYEVKANLRDEDLDQFVRAGVTMIQPGIESLATNVLQRMAKGVSALQNIWLLRECAARRIELWWNLLTGVPGETAADYEAMLAIMPLLEHLRAPSGCGPLRIDRYSPYFTRAPEYGIDDLRPFPVYRHLYPEPADPHRIAYHFTGDYRTEYLASNELQQRLEAAIEAWKAAEQRDPPARLIGIDLDDDNVMIQDSRSCAVEPFVVLSGKEKRALAALDRPLRRDRVPEALREEVAGLLERRIVVAHEERLLSLVTRPSKGADLERLRRQRRAARPRPELVGTGVARPAPNARSERADQVSSTPTNLGA